MVQRLNWHHHTTQSYYPEIEPISPCPILLMLSTRLGSNSINFKIIGLTRPRFKPMGLGFKPMRFGFNSLLAQDMGVLLIQPKACTGDTWREWIHNQRIKIVLGFVVSKNMPKADPSKVAAIRDILAPTTKKYDSQLIIIDWSCRTMPM